MSAPTAKSLSSLSSPVTADSMLLVPPHSTSPASIALNRPEKMTTDFTPTGSTTAESSHSESASSRTSAARNEGAACAEKAKGDEVQVEVVSAASTCMDADNLRSGITPAPDVRLEPSALHPGGAFPSKLEAAATPDLPPVSHCHPPRRRQSEDSQATASTFNEISNVRARRAIGLTTLITIIVFLFTWAITIFFVALNDPGTMKEEAVSRILSIVCAAASMFFLFVTLIPTTLSALQFHHIAQTFSRKTYMYLIALGAIFNVASTLCVGIATHPQSASRTGTGGGS
ncbi:unnamed protein product [Peniophora sp. CBMAI 1063]|nr:unnamed protein product [Peniophora sp. CBMAI 1063]